MGFLSRFARREKRGLLKDVYLERAIFSSRLFLLALIGLALTGTLVFRLVNLQIVEHDRYRLMAENNRVRLSPIPPSRGLIYDRNGHVLANNIPSYTLELVPEQIEDLPNTLLRLSRIIELGDDEIAAFKKLEKRSRKFHAIPLKFNLSEEEVARFYVDQFLFPGVSIEARENRYYPEGELFAHVIGYVGRISEKDQKRLDKENYRGTSHVGKVGIERYYESLLHGTVGVRQDEVNSRGRHLRTLSKQPGEAGHDLVLTLDTRLQKAARDALGKESGSIVAMNPKTGEVLAMVSTPGFDPNLFVNGISYKDYGRLRDDPEQPLFNRSLKGRYPPGSTVKPVVALAGLDAGIMRAEDRMFAGSFYQLANDPRKYRDWKKSGHGWVNMDTAIAQSCDVYFYDLAFKLGIDRLSKVFAEFGLGRKTGIDLLGESPALLPTREWKRKKYREAWYPGETLIVGIGQGYMLTTPLQLAQMTSCLAMRGTCHKPYLLDGTRLGDEEGPGAEQQGEVFHVQAGDEEQWDQVIRAMEHVMNGPTGTARKVAAGAPYSIAGKTGTSQVFGLKADEKYDAEKLRRKLHDHSLFVGFAPVEDPQIAVAVLVEHGGSGSRVAAPIARKVMDAWLLPPDDEDKDESPQENPAGQKESKKTQ